MTQETPILASTTPHDAKKQSKMTFTFSKTGSPLWACYEHSSSNCDGNLSSQQGDASISARQTAHGAGMTQSVAIPNAYAPSPPESRAASPLPGEELAALPFSGRASRHQKLPSSFIYRGAFSTVSDESDGDSDEDVEITPRWSSSTTATTSSFELEDDIGNVLDNALFNLDEDYFSSSDDDSGRSCRGPTSAPPQPQQTRASPSSGLVRARTGLLSSYRSVKDIHAAYLGSSILDPSLHRTRSFPTLRRLVQQSEEHERRRSLPLPIPTKSPQ